MLKQIEKISKYSTKNLTLDIKEFLSYLWELKTNNNTKLNVNNFFYNDENISYADNLVEIFNMYNLSKRYGGIYFLTNNIENIVYMYSEIVNTITLPKFLKEILLENIKSFKINGKINVFKEIEYIKYIFIKDNIFKKNDFSKLNIEIIIKEDKNIINAFDLDLLKVINNKTLLHSLISRNVTTVYNRKSYEIHEAIKRIKKDFQSSLINFIFLNNYDYKNDLSLENILQYMNTFLYSFWKNIIKYYINDYIYYLANYKHMHKIEILAEVNHLLIEIEWNILEDYNIIIDDNNEIYDYMKNYFIKLIKEGVIWKNKENTYIDKNHYTNKLKDLFNYRIYY